MPLIPRIKISELLTGIKAKQQQQKRELFLLNPNIEKY